jgi:hypothetical protein
MKNTTRIIVGSALALLVLAGAITFGTWRYEKYRHMPPAAQAVILRDRSDSYLSGCADTAAMGQELVDSPFFGKGSAIALMVTGDDSTAGEPVLLAALEVPTTQRVVEGRSAIKQRQQGLLDKIRERCVAAGQTKRSPIYIAIRRAVEYLRAHGCDGRSQCTVYVQSDLEELSETSIKEVLSGGSSNRKTLSALPTPIENRGIDVKICGLSETAGAIEVDKRKQRVLTPNHDAQRADRIHSVWEELFTDPTRVVFNSHCPKGQP